MFFEFSVVLLDWLSTQSIWDMRKMIRDSFIFSKAYLDEVEDNESRLLRRKQALFGHVDGNATLTKSLSKAQLMKDGDEYNKKRNDLKNQELDREYLLGFLSLQLANTTVCKSFVAAKFMTRLYDESQVDWKIADDYDV